MSRIKLYILFLLYCSFSAAQIPIDKYFQIKYTKAHCSRGNTGEYQKEEIFKFELLENEVILKEFVQISYSFIYNVETQKNDLSISDTIKEFPNKKIRKKIINNLFSSLNENGNNFNSQFIKNYLPKKINKEHILKIAKRMNTEYWFLDDNTGKLDEFGRARIKLIQNFDRFDEYIKLITPKEDEVVFIDGALNYAQITLEGSNSIYTLDFFQKFGQPIRHCIGAEKVLNTINLKSNLILLDIIPKSNLSEKLTLENIIENYVYWYIENIKLDLD